MKKIKVIDSIMGAGKTSYAIQKIQESDKSEKFIYITPFLSEVERIKSSCKDKKFVEPINKGVGKLNDLHNILSNGSNVVSTHSLFRLANPITKEILNSQGYTLILDEVMDVIERLDLKKDDIDTIIDKKYAEIIDDFLVWKKEDYNGRYNDIKSMSENGSVIIINDKALFWNFPVEIFNSFKDVYILTYMFEAQIQKYYYDFHNVEYEYFSVIKNDNKYELKEYNINYDLEIMKNIYNKINIIENDKINNIGDSHYSLSVSWFEKDENEPLVKILKNNIYNFFRNKSQSKNNEKLWTTFKSSQNKLKGKGYTNRFIPINTRATNVYSESIYLAYCCNIFLHPDITLFFSKRNVKINQEEYALSEMLQWIYRSAIRNNRKINIYIPSKRMRILLKNWLTKS